MKKFYFAEMFDQGNWAINQNNWIYLNIKDQNQRNDQQILNSQQSSQGNDSIRPNHQKQANKPNKPPLSPKRDENDQGSSSSEDDEEPQIRVSSRNKLKRRKKATNIENEDVVMGNTDRNQNQKIQFVGVPILNPFNHQQNVQPIQNTQFAYQPPPPQHYSNHHPPKSNPNPLSQPISSNFLTNPLLNNQYGYKTF